MHSSALECTHAVRATLYRPNDQTQSDAIRCHPMPSDAITTSRLPDEGGHQVQSGQSGALRGNQMRFA